MTIMYQFSKHRKKSKMNSSVLSSAYTSNNINMTIIYQLRNNNSNETETETETNIANETATSR